LPESRDQYVHRLGRTARAGKMGSGLLVLCPFESIFLQQLQGLDVNKDSEIEHLLKSPSNHVTDNLNRVLHDISKGDASMQYLAEQAYQSFLGYYVDKWKCSNFRSKEEVVKTANNIARLMGLGYVPHLSKDVVHKMGLSGIEGICLAKEREMVHRRGSSEHEDGRHQLR
jgi:ATP-dependent RNA helicase MSS116